MPQSDQQPHRTPGANPGRKALPAGNGSSVTDGPKVVEAEVLHGDADAGHEREDARRDGTAAPAGKNIFIIAPPTATAATALPDCGALAERTAMPVWPPASPLRCFWSVLRSLAFWRAWASCFFTP